MLCPYCQYDETRVIDSRGSTENAVRRRRECLKCHRRFTTYEKVEAAPLRVIKKGGARVPFDREKLRDGISRACHKRPISSADIDRLVGEVEADLFDNFEREAPSREIGERVSQALKELDEVAYLRFDSVYRQFQAASDFAEPLAPALRGPK